MPENQRQACPCGFLDNQLSLLNKLEDVPKNVDGEDIQTGLLGSTTHVQDEHTCTSAIPLPCTCKSMGEGRKEGETMGERKWEKRKEVGRGTEEAKGEESTWQAQVSAAKPENLPSILELNMQYRENTCRRFPFDLHAHTCLGRYAIATY